VLVYTRRMVELLHTSIEYNENTYKNRIKLFNDHIQGVKEYRQMLNPLEIQSNARYEGVCSDVEHCNREHVCQIKQIMTPIRVQSMGLLLPPEVLGRENQNTRCILCLSLLQVSSSLIPLHSQSHLLELAATNHDTKLLHSHYSCTV
jgi:hypothetical protein